MQKLRTVSNPSPDAATARPGDPCIMVLFGASGDLAKRLLMPALYNLLLDGLLPAQFALVGIAKDELTTDSFRERMSKDIRTFNTRKDFNDKAWQDLCGRLYYLPGDFADRAAFVRLRELVGQLDAQYQAKGNILFYLAVPPAVFGLISANIGKAGFKDSSPHAPRGEDNGWRRLIVEKPFGTDLHSAEELNRQILSYWDESQIYRVDHYLGKETVQNILAFRFANGMFEPLWNRQYVDHIQFSVSESVSVEGRGGYYDRSGVLRDMIQNHMFQMLAYVCMEPPGSFAADDIRDEKAKLLKAVRVYKEQEVGENAVRGQYGSGKTAGGTLVPDYRQEPDVNQRSNTETYAAPAAVHRQLALGWRAILPSFGQGALEARHRGCCAIQETAGHAVPRHGGSQALCQPAYLSHSTRPGYRIVFPGQDAWSQDAAPAGQHALQLR